MAVIPCQILAPLIVREEIQNARSTSDPISHLKKVIIDLGVAAEADLKEIDKQAKKTVDDAQSSEPNLDEFHPWPRAHCCTSLLLK
jgi:TPP-dependent pyruvate/acetoin dehydrogenase alpha subunit